MNDNPNKSSILDLVNSFCSELKINVHENTVMYIDKYYLDQTNDTDEDFIIQESELPQITLNFPTFSEDKTRRTIYPFIVKDLNSYTYKDYGPPTYYDFIFKIDFLTQSVTELIELQEKFIEYIKNIDGIFKTQSGGEFYIDLEGQLGGGVTPNFSDLRISTFNIKISQVPIFKTNHKIGHLVKEIIFEYYHITENKQMFLIKN